MVHKVIPTRINPFLNFDFEELDQYNIIVYYMLKLVILIAI